MSKIAVVYWSGTGNTEAMANLVAQGAKDKGAEADVLLCSEFNASMIENYSAFAFGCPSMGAEELEDSEFQPMWDDVKDSLADKKVALFGSYGWGDGEWMRNWAEEISADSETFICCDAPAGDDEVACQDLGANLV